MYQSNDKAAVTAAAEALRCYGWPLLVASGLRQPHPDSPGLADWLGYFAAGDLTAEPPASELWLMGRRDGQHDPAMTPMKVWSAVVGDDIGGVYSMPDLNHIAAAEFSGSGFPNGLETTFDLTSAGLGIVSVRDLIAGVETRVAELTGLNPA